MKITFLGATKTVTGSNYLVEAAGKKFLVDCGMWQGKAELEEENFQEFDFNPAEIDFMLLTHAHIDHSGRIPKLYNEIVKVINEGEDYNSDNEDYSNSNNGRQNRRIRGSYNSTPTLNQFGEDLTKKAEEGKDSLDYRFIKISSRR